MVILGLVVILSFASRVPFLASKGITFYTIISGSMEPAIPAGSIVYSGPFEIDKLQKGDIVTFTRTVDAKSIVITHRIVEVSRKEVLKKLPDGKEQKVIDYRIKTKGDANSTNDEWIVTAGEILGLYKWHIPKLGYVSMFAQTPQGFVLLVLLPGAILVIWEIVSIINHFRKRYEQKAQSEIEKLKEELLKVEKKVKKSGNKKKRKKNA